MVSEIFRNGAVLVMTPGIGRQSVQRTPSNIVAALHNNKRGGGRGIPPPFGPASAGMRKGTRKPPQASLRGNTAKTVMCPFSL
jgi:hypothetical protein